MKRKILAILAMAVAVFAAFIVIGIVAPAPDSSPKQQIPACEVEDGSMQETCRWDAQTQGNGEGRSYTSYDFGDRIVYDSER